MKIRTVIVEDEQAALDHLESLLISFCPNIEVVGHASDVARGFEVISQLAPDLLISDIKLPDGTAFDLLNRFSKINFNIIFVTAYSEYAVKAFKICAMDYLLKPIDIDELIQAVQKAEEEHKNQSIELRLKALLENIAHSDAKVKKIALSVNTAIHLIPVNEIVFCRSDGTRTVFYLEDGRFLTAQKSVKEYDEILSEYGFFRTNRQFLINVQHVISYDKNEDVPIKMSNGLNVPISFRKRDDFHRLISENY